MPNANGHNGHHHHDIGGDHGPQKIEICKPTGELSGYFDVIVHDPNGVDPITIIKAGHDWEMSFEVWLHGDIWKCVSGAFCPEVFFERINDGERLELSVLLGDADALVYDFVGCREDYKDGVTHSRWTVTIPAGTVPPGAYKPAIYDWNASLTFRDPCGNYGVLAGRDRGSIQVWGQDRQPAVVG